MRAIYRSQLKRRRIAYGAVVVAYRANLRHTRQRHAQPLLPDAPARVARAATPMAFVNAVLLGYRKYGADPSDALREAQIAPALLNEPDARITASQFEALCRVAMQQLDDEALGWFSRRLPWGSYGLLCRASLTSPNLGVALKRWCRHHRLLTDDIAREPDDR